MTVGHVNVKETIDRIQKEIFKDKSISPVLISSIVNHHILLMLLVVPIILVCNDFIG